MDLESEPIKSFSGIVPDEEFYKLLRERAEKYTDPYRIACWSFSEEHKALRRIGRVPSALDTRGAPEFRFDPRRLELLVRRLFVEFDSTGDEIFYSLASSIAETLRLELV